MVKLSLKKLDGTTVEKTLEKPRYGGTITTLYLTDPAGWDPTNGVSSTAYFTQLAYEGLQIGDFYRSPVGTGEYPFSHFFYIPMEFRMGQIAESWEQPDPLTYVWHIRKPLDVDAMKKSAAFLVGTHDFKAFEGSGSPRSSTVRTIIKIDLFQQPGDLLRIVIQANGFLRFMVRNIVGTLVEAGFGKITPEGFSHILESKDRNLAGATAPAKGLTLASVEYA